jgi:DNA-directed RNA polymerase specialized sigma24 family protein
MQSQSFEPQWLANCDVLIVKALSSRGWVLADDPALFGSGDTFRSRVLARVAEWVGQERRPLDDKLVVDAVKNEYSRLLEAAIRFDGSRVQSVALTEAIRYAWPIALQRCTSHDQAEAAILRAATQVWLHIDRCYPGSFLAFFGQIVLNETKALGRQERRVTERETPESDLIHPAAGEEQDERSPLDTALHLAQQVGQLDEDIREVERRLTRSWVIEKLRACLEHARREFIIIGQFFLDLNASELAQQLAVSVQIVYTEKNRALVHIRKCCAELIAALRSVVYA